MHDQQLARSQQCHARSLFYGAVADLLLDGLTDNATRVLRGIDAVRVKIDESADADALAAEHYRLFGRNILPYTSAYVELRGQLGGVVSDLFSTWYDFAAWEYDSLQEAPDHFGIQFRFLAFLSEVESRAIESGSRTGADMSSGLGRHFVANYMLVGWPPFSAAVARSGNTFYATALQVGTQILLDHAALPPPFVGTKNLDLGLSDLHCDGVLAVLQSDTADFDTSGPKEALQLDVDLDQSRTSLKDVADYLTSCRRSGAFISQTDISDISTKLDIPRGFGSRSMTLENMIRTASSLGDLDTLIGRLKTLFESACTDWPPHTGPDIPEVLEITQYFSDRVGRTIGLLARIQDSQLLGQDEIG